jgi:hypothetical protein
MTPQCWTAIAHASALMANIRQDSDTVNPDGKNPSFSGHITARDRRTLPASWPPISVGISAPPEQC